MDARFYPAPCRASIRKITKAIGVNVETAYSMIRMTAALMDLRPEDDDVVRIIFQDCGITDG